MLLPLLSAGDLIELDSSAHHSSTGGTAPAATG
jgi:hypothetical protein